MKKSICNISIMLVKQIHYITEKGRIGSASRKLVMLSPPLHHVVEGELRSAYYKDIQFISVYITCILSNNVVIWRST